MLCILLRVIRAASFFIPFADLMLGVTALVSYERAKAESLGLSAKGGLMERGERMFLLGVSFLSTVIFVPVLWVLLVLVSFTAISRFVKVWNAASGRDAVIRRRVAPFRRNIRADGHHNEANRILY